MTKNKSWTIEDLNKYYNDADGVDQPVFAEQRSNLLLYAGDHYNKRNSSFYKRIRDSKDLSHEQKIRLTKNHTQYICDVYVNNIVAPNPGVGFSPKNEKEIHDQKAADLHHAVWRDAHEKYSVDSLIDDWADSFVQVGEVAVKIYFDPNKGKIKAYEQKVNADGLPLFIDHNGEETTDDGSSMGMQHGLSQDESKPIYTGEFCMDEIYGFNLLRPPECKDIRKAAWLTDRYMAYKKDLIKTFPDKEKFIKEGEDKTYQIFDAASGGYGKSSSDQVCVRETYVRPCADYPEGYFFIWTEEGILAEGELPGGIFPIAVGLFRKLPTSPRGRGPIKTIRPYQAELNRTSSKIAEHQITIGDDKILLQNGTKVSASVSLPGIRTVNYTGAEPKILAGRDGSQYLAYATSIISELYQIMGIKEDTEELPAQLDPYVMLFRAARQKKKFQRYIKRFENFLIEVVEIYLKLAKIHLPDDYLVYALGATEIVNIPEFRALSDICYEVKIEAQAEDIETKLGKQIVINNALQYVGSQLKPEDIGKLMRNMPYSNFDESFDDMTIDYDSSVNDLLALDRGEQPAVNQYDNHVYSIKRLTARMRKADFKYLAPQIQMNYAQKIKIHQEFEAQNVLAIQRAQQGLIPTGGYLVTADLYVPDPANPNKTQRVRLPSESMQWLIKQIQAQQSALAPVMDMNQGAQAELANTFTQMSSPQMAINQQASGV